MAVELLGAGSIVALVAFLAALTRRVRARASGSVSEAQARQNAAPLATAIPEAWFVENGERPSMMGLLRRRPALTCRPERRGPRSNGGPAELEAG